MEIKIAREIGYCYGVRDAVQAAVDEAEHADGRKVYTYGPIIHNRQTIEELESKHGVVTANSVEEIAGDSTVVIRTHGVPLETTERLNERGLKVVDATCPFVQKTQVRARKFIEGGFHLVILGKKQHPEVISIAGVAGKQCTVVEHPEDIELVPRIPKIAVVFQSTVAYDDFEWAIPALAAKCYEINILKTICGVTITRQKRTEEIAREVDVMIIIGGKNSSNTKKLVDLSEKHAKRTHHIEGPEELDAIDFRGVSSVGVGSGTSTPQSLVDAVVEKLHTIADEVYETCQPSGIK